MMLAGAILTGSAAYMWRRKNKPPKALKHFQVTI